MSIKQNVLANYLGQGWTALMGLAFIPFYIATLGIEAWGLVGFMVMLQAWFVLLDMGLTPAMSREMARFVGGEHSAQSIRDLLRSLEIVYGGISATIILVVWFGADWLAENWLNSNHLDHSTVSHALAFMGLVIAARMTEQVYRGVIQGLQRQVWLNGSLAIMATLRWAGVIPVMLWIEGSVRIFFIWQGLISIISIAVLAQYTYRNLPPTVKPGRFVLQALNNIKGFAGGMAATTLLALILTQIDKLLLSKLVSLNEFGYYTLAANVAGALGFLVAPIATAVLPRMTECLARSDHQTVLATYHSASQWLAVVLIPVSIMMAAFSEPLMFAWSGNRDLAIRTAPLLSVLALGTMCNGFMHVPYMAQLAHGWTGLAVRINIVAVSILTPVIIWSVPRFGVMGAAWAWLLLNAGYLLIGMHFMHRRLMHDEKWKWYREAVFFPLVVASIIVMLTASLLELPDDRLEIILILLLVGFVTLIGVIVTVPSSRNFFVRKLGCSKGGWIGDFK